MENVEIVNLTVRPARPIPIVKADGVMGLLLWDAWEGKSFYTKIHVLQYQFLWFNILNH